ncbi:hypothetical protein BVY03_04830 [bacterium K02(2017)]|nr:hypothetical protein BVY03_04830 [bacterium K02(2017)]
MFTQAFSSGLNPAAAFKSIASEVLKATNHLASPLFEKIEEAPAHLKKHLLGIEETSTPQWGLRTRDLVTHPALHLGVAALSLPIVQSLVLYTLGPGDASSPRFLIKFFEAYQRLIGQDLTNVEDGYYPRDLLYQFPLTQYLKASPSIIKDIPDFIARMKANKRKDLPSFDQIKSHARLRLSQLGVTDEDEIQNYLRNLEKAKNYYLQNFHWQTDGWFSLESAARYDASVETLFFGAADMMRRQTIPLIVKHYNDDPDGFKVLDVASGTGRLLSQINRALPEAKLTGLDLSVDYLLHSKKHLSDDIMLLPGNAQDMPLKEASFNVVVIGYLMHELPYNIRSEVYAEAKRILKPGGLLIVYDSIQHDEPDENIAALVNVTEGSFANIFNEVYYNNYRRDSIRERLENMGMSGVKRKSFLYTTIVSGIKKD